MDYVPSTLLAIATKAIDASNTVQGFSILLAAIAFVLFTAIVVASVKTILFLHRVYHSENVQEAIADIKQWFLVDVIHPLFVRIEGDR